MKRMIDSNIIDKISIKDDALNIDGTFTADEIVENMSGYSFTELADQFTGIYAGVCKNGNKITFVIYGKINIDVAIASLNIGRFNVPQEIYSKLYGGVVGEDDYIDTKQVYLSVNYATGVNKPAIMYKADNDTRRLDVNIYSLSDLSLNTDYYVRYEVTFLLSDNLIS